MRGHGRGSLLILLTAIFVPALSLAQPMQPMQEDDGEDDPKPLPAPSASAVPSGDIQPDRDAGVKVAPVASSGAHPLGPPHAQIPGMVFVPGGRFVMGAAAADKTSAPNERPSHTEVVEAFYIDKTEVTVDAYHACVEKRACQAPAKTSALCTYSLGDPLLPVSCVHWSNADAYCRSVQKRLPRETEWELAARGRSAARFPWGGAPGGCNFAATLLHESTGRSCSGKRPSRVGTHLSGQSPFGVMDMSGNVEEWVSDYYVEHIAEGVAPRSGASRVLRGGGWLSPPSMTKATSRNWGSTLEAGPNVGFRCAKDKG